MKKTIILTGLLALATVGVQAQEKTEDGVGDAVVGGSANVRADITLSPVLHIQLGSGATSKNGDVDVVDLGMTTVGDYDKGVTKRIDRLLKVFAMGTTYVIWAKLSNGYSEEVSEELYKIMQMNVGSPDRESSQPVDMSSSMMAVHQSHREHDFGYKELYGTFYIKPMTPENLQTFNNLLGKNNGSNT